MKDFRLAIFGLAVLTAMGSQAQTPASPQGDTWASIAKLPDWQGIWELDWRGGGLGRGPACAAETDA